MKLLICTLSLRKCRLLRRTPSLLCDRNRCEGSETRGEEILKALEHHQTGKTPTHGRAEKSPQICPGLSKWQFVCRKTAPPSTPTRSYPPVNEESSSFHPIPPSAERLSGRSRSLWSFRFAASDSSLICCDIYLPPCPVSLSSEKLVVT